MEENLLYGDLVEVLGGFYKGKRGIVLRRIPLYQYEVEINCYDALGTPRKITETFILEELKKIGGN